MTTTTAIRRQSQQYRRETITSELQPICHPPHRSQRPTDSLAHRLTTTSIAGHDPDRSLPVRLCRVRGALTPTVR